MTKAELIQKVAEECEMTQADVRYITEMMFDLIVVALLEGEDVVLPRIGKLVVANTAARKGVIDGKAWETKPGKTVKLRLSKADNNVKALIAE